MILATDLPLRRRVAQLRTWGQKVTRRVRTTKGVTLIELIAVAVVLGVFALIVAPNVESALGLSKTSAFATTLSELQSASDNFFAISNAYPTYSGATVANQPSATSFSQINAGAQDQNGATFVPSYIRQAPTASAANNGLNTTNGADTYYGVTGTGIVFATQESPVTGAWTVASDTNLAYTAADTAGAALDSLQ